ncbi:hypothetical protein [Streptomyces sp. WM6378]|uniref:hypothetical protein n=1 Tax=Streptomyces sp. WM6378 TaxID=1415557 RepID=UPI00131D96FE|nr:hypothetical protein [Streptomyces sp. WM6378]
MPSPSTAAASWLQESPSRQGWARSGTAPVRGARRVEDAAVARGQQPAQVAVRGPIGMLGRGDQRQSEYGGDCAQRETGPVP